MIIHKRSWHYKVASMFDSYPRSDICAYTRQILWHIFATIFIFAATVGLTMSYGDLLAAIAAIIIYQTIFEPWWVAVPALLLSVAAITLLACIFVSSKLNDIPSNNFVRTAYTSWRDKFCIRINFE